MFEELARDEEVFFVAALFATIAVVVVVVSCGSVIVQLARIFSNDRLKRLMIERGMTADEIERIVQAGSNDSRPSGGKPEVPPVRKPEPVRRG
jgi:hypothetical protein